MRIILISVVFTYCTYCLLAGFSLLQAGNRTAEQMTPTNVTVTFNRDIAPIVFQNCVPCHRPGGSGPFSQLTYDEVRSHARAIQQATSIRFMPPWLPEPGYGDFTGVRHLSDEEIQKIRRWVDEGTPRGNPADLPPAPKFSADWQLGKPDLVLHLTKPYQVRISTTDVYQNFIIPVPLTEKRYVKAIEVRPNDPRLLHHANILLDRTRSCREREAHPGDPIPGMDVPIRAKSFAPATHFLSWKPGTVAQYEPEGLDWELDPGTDLILNTHFQPRNKPEIFTVSIALYFTDKPPTLHPILIQLQGDDQLDIPPGVHDFAVTDSYTLPMDVDVLGVYPHAHYLGDEMRSYAVLPDGTTTWLIWIKHWDMHWQGVYRYKAPVFLPRGTVIHMRYTYDNSEGNPMNPNHPPRRVTAGNRGTDEMSHLWIQMLPRQAVTDGKDSRAVLEAVLMQHRLDKHPDDFYALSGLAFALAGAGDLQAATPVYEKIAHMNPKDPRLQMAWGTALQLQGKLDEAIPRFQSAVQLATGQEEMRDALHDLGSCLLQNNQIEEALEQFRAELKLDASNHGARDDVARGIRAQANALLGEDRAPDAVRVLHEALQLAPGNADTYNVLGVALLQENRIEEAVADFKRALQINPNHKFAKLNLEQIQAQLNQPTAK
jgi:Flp pilus assembly protein TadD/mono/diheme cytochrome c family protein